MRPKSGLPKRRALRNMPVFQWGFRSHPGTAGYRNPALDGGALLGASEVVSLFAGCGGLDLGFLGGFRYRGILYDALPFKITHAVDNDERAIETYRLNIGRHAVKIPSAELPKSRVLENLFKKL
jgi:DNA (cytosine-5)-methyltransferase 1